MFESFSSSSFVLGCFSDGWYQANLLPIVFLKFSSLPFCQTASILTEDEKDLNMAPNRYGSADRPKIVDPAECFR
jgi:hypothetical protein